MSKRLFVDNSFSIPQQLETDRMRLRMLKVTDVVKDFDAVMSSVEHLQSNKTFGPQQKWPIGLTLEQNLIDLGWHQKEFQRRSSFAYTVMNLDESECLGCVYIEPSSNVNYEAMVFLWVRQSQVEQGLDAHLFESVKSWMLAEWPFKSIAYPGREFSWDDWQK